MKKNPLAFPLKIAALALLVVSIPLYADTPAPAASSSSGAPAAQGGLPPDLQQALQLPAGPDQNKAVGAAVKAWGQQDPKATADWLIQQTEPRTNLFIHGHFLGWTARDAAAAEAYSLQIQANRDYRYIAIFSVADGLCRKKATEATAWAPTLTAQDDRNAAIDGTITIWIRGDLPGVTAWTKQMNPADMKWAVLVAARNWNLTKFGPLAAWLDQLPLSADDKAATLKPPYPDSMHISKYKALASAATPAKP